MTAPTQHGTRWLPCVGCVALAALTVACAATPRGHDRPGPDAGPSEVSSGACAEPVNAAFCLLRVQAPAAEPVTDPSGFTATVTEVAIVSRSSDCWDDSSALRSGAQPAHQISATLQADDGAQWILKLEEQGGVTAAAVGGVVEIRTASRSGEFWSQHGLRVEDSQGLLTAVGCAPPGVLSEPSGATCAVENPGDGACGRTEYAGETTVTFEGHEVAVALGEVVEQDAFEVSASMGTFDASRCGPQEGPGTLCEIRIVRVDEQP